MKAVIEVKSNGKPMNKHASKYEEKVALAPLTCDVAKMLAFKKKVR